MNNIIFVVSVSKDLVWETMTDKNRSYDYFHSPCINITYLSHISKVVSILFIFFPSYWVVLEHWQWDQSECVLTADIAITVSSVSIPACTALINCLLTSPGLNTYSICMFYTLAEWIFRATIWWAECRSSSSSFRVMVFQSSPTPNSVYFIFSWYSVNNALETTI